MNNNNNNNEKYRKYLINDINYDIFIKDIAKSYLNNSIGWIDGDVHFQNTENEEDDIEFKKFKSYHYIKEIYNKFQDNLTINTNSKGQFDLITIIQLFLVYIKPNFQEIIIFKNTITDRLNKELKHSIDLELLFNSDLDDSILSLDLLKIRSTYIDEACNNMGDDKKDYEISNKVLNLIKSHSVNVYNEIGNGDACIDGNLINIDKFKLSTMGKYHISSRVHGIKGVEYGNLSIASNFQLVKDLLSIMSGGLTDILDYGNGDDDMANAYIIGGSLVSCVETLPIDYINLYNECLENLKVMNSLNSNGEISTISNTQNEFKDKVGKVFKRSESDIDIIVTCPTLDIGIEKVKNLAIQIVNWLESKEYDYRFIRTPNSITIIGDKFRAIQIITLFSKNVEEHLIFCDLDCTAISYNGNNVKMIPRSIQSFNNRVVLVTNKMERSQKYSTRGYFCKNFEYCKHLDRCVAKNSISEKYEKYSSIPFHHVQFKSMDRILQFLKQNFKSKFVTKELDVIFDEELIGQNSKFGSIKDYSWKIGCLTVNGLISCYICKKKIMYSKMDITPSSLCSDCFKFNEFHSMEFNDKLKSNELILNTKYALVTGARCKIGFECAAILLSHGFNVIATTRFPHLANEQFKLKFNSDPTILSRLHIYGLDFRSIGAVQEFINHIKSKFPRIDILINNAAQTIRRPRAYYSSLLKNEKEIQLMLLDSQIDEFQNLEIGNDKDDEDLEIISNSSGSSGNSSAIVEVNKNNNTLALYRVEDHKFGGITSTSIIESVLLPEDMDKENEVLFPSNQFDAHGEPLDMRPKTSWNSQIDEISTVEMGEINLVNSIIPTMLVSQLVPHMERKVNNNNSGRNNNSRGNSRYNNNNNNNNSIPKLDWSFIINVSSSEGDFDYDYNNQSGNHAVSNMAKAALNMLTRSTATPLEKKFIHSAVVNTGWCSDMGPNTDEDLKPRSKRARKQYPIPLSCFDGASRVLHPIFNKYYSESPFPTGQMFVNYKIKPWQ